jgi:hypothetical protein
VVGVFRQHTSRRLDPQLHTHAVIANRVRGPDGRWLALDARPIICDQRTLSALYHAANRAELTRRLGVGWETPENGIAEIVGVPEAIRTEFSRRTSDIERSLGERLERFRDNLDREPSRRERWRLEREAVLVSRPGKPRSPTLTELREEWRQRVEALGLDPSRLVERMLRHQRRLQGIDRHDAERITSQGMEALIQRQSSWRPTELVRELAAAIPTTVTADAKELTGFLETLADGVARTRCADISRPVPDGVPLRRDGRPVTEAAVDQALTTQPILDEEEYLVAWARRRLAVDLDRARRQFRSVEGLSPGQAEAVAAVTGPRRLELIVGPAGAGKTTTLATAVSGLNGRGRNVFGVAPTAAAAEVLATETGMAADTLDKLLTEHTLSTRPAHSEYDLPAGTTVIVDEAGTADTPNLAELARLADEHHWRVILVGDPRQFTAVGRGGMFAHLVERFGAVELDQVHRFGHRWEGEASLRLRSGDPGVLTEYERHGRIHNGPFEQMEKDVMTTWKEARDPGGKVALMANTTETVRRLNQLAQQARIDTGELDPSQRGLRVGDQKLLVGDKVVTRRNDRRLRTHLGIMVKNRNHWTITTIHGDGSITVTGTTGKIRLPTNYVASDVELGYAETSHATQGRTVDTALLLIDRPTDSRGVYTPMTRGRETNHVYVVTDNQTALDVLTRALSRDWIDQPAIARRTQLELRSRRHLKPPDKEQRDEVDELVRQARWIITERQARRRELERTLGRGL